MNETYLEEDKIENALHPHWNFKIGICPIYYFALCDPKYLETKKLYKLRSHIISIQKRKQIGVVMPGNEKNYDLIMDLGKMSPDYEINYYVETIYKISPKDRKIISKKIYYALFHPMEVTPKDEEYPVFFLYHLFIIIKPSQVTRFLEFQFQECIEARVDFFQMFDIALCWQKTEKFAVNNRVNLKIAEKWIKYKTQKNNENQVVATKPINSGKKLNELTDGQSTLVVYYILDHYIEIGMDIYKTDIARIIHLLIGKPIPGPVKDTEIYHKMCKAPFFKSNKFLKVDLEITKKLFEEYGLMEIAKKVQMEIEFCKKENEQNKENKYINNIGTPDTSSDY